MELDESKVKDMAHQLWALMDSCRFVGYDLTKEKDRLKGQYTIHEIYASGDYKALRYDTSELEAKKGGLYGALHEINRLKERCAKISKDIEYFEGIFKKLNNE